MNTSIIILLMVMIFAGGCSVGPTDDPQCWYQEGVVTFDRFRLDFSECKNEVVSKALNAEVVSKALNDRLTPEEFNEEFNITCNRMFEECMQLKGYRVMDWEDFADVNEAFCPGEGGVTRISPKLFRQSWQKKK